jgi:hypothetical protein
MNLFPTYVIMILISFLSPIYAQQQTDILWPTLANTDWPMIKHDPQFTGRSSFKGPQTPTIIWTKDMENGIFSGPVIGVEGNLYFGSYYVLGDYFYSYGPHGEYIWEFQTGSGLATQAGILIDSSNTIYFGSRDSCLYALDPKGRFKWKYKTSAAIYQEIIPNIDLEGNIYITNSNGELYSIKPIGNLNWNVSYENGFGSGSPVFSPDGNTIYIAGRDSNLFALNLDGSIKWKFSCGGIMRAPIIDSDGNVYFSSTDWPQYLYSIKTDGSIRWQYPLRLGTYIYSIPTIDKDGNLYAIDRDSSCCPFYWLLFSLDYSGELRWEYVFNEEETDDFWQPLICDSEGTVYVGSTFGYNYYAISNDGTLKWKLPLEFNSQQVDNTGAISKDGTLYLGVHNTSLITNQTKTLIAIKDTGTVSVDENKNIIKDYWLSQNYPNPFNPKTTINYTVKERGLVQLKVYDILGKQVTTLVNEEKSQGSYSISFNGNSLPTGVYVYSLQVNDFLQNMKMILLK